MKTLLRIDASVRHEGSYSRTLGDFFVSQWQNQNPDGRIILRDLRDKPVPHLVQSVADAFFSPEPDQQQLALSDELIGEIKASNDILITCPMYNFQLPSSLKAYIDHVVRNNETIQYTPEGYRGLLTGKKAYIITVTGGKRLVPAPYDAFENYLKNILGFMGIQDTTSISLEGTADPEYVKGVIAATKKRITGIVQTG
jgi:FMN-dependent NADH-azoreductase